MSVVNEIEITTRPENANGNASVAVAAIDTTDFVKKTTSNSENSEQQPPQQQQQAKQVHTTTIITQIAPAPMVTPQPPKADMDSDIGLSNFKVLYVLAQLCGLTLIVLMGCWIGVHLGGTGWTDTPNLEFNWHPLLMTIGMIFLYGNSILVYRGFRNVRKKSLKITHASIHIAAFVLTVIALKTVFDSHNLAANPIPNMYSLHSWMGLAAVIIFGLQYVAGFMAFLWPGFKDNFKIALMPLHIYFGLFGFVLAIASALTGLTEKAFFSMPSTYKDLPSSALMVNFSAVLFIVFGALVVFLTTEPSYKRRPIPEDTVLLTGMNE